MNLGLAPPGYMPPPLRGFCRSPYEQEIERTFEVDGQEVSFRDLFRRQAERLARTVVQGETYRSFRLPC